MPGKKKKNQQKQKPALSKAKFAEHLNNYNSLRDAIDHQYLNRTKPLAPKPKMRVQIS
jgi:hypothetical protein